MLRRYSQILITCLFVGDLTLTLLSGIAAFELRYLEAVQKIMPVTGDIPQTARYVTLLLLALPLAAIAYKASGLYTARRVSSHFREFFDISRATAGVIVALITLNFFSKGFDYSRGVIVVFFFLNVLALGFSRVVAREVLRWARRRGWNKRYVLVVGAGRLGQKVAQNIRSNPWTGLKLVGFVDSREARIGNVYEKAQVLGDLDHVGDMVDTHHVDQVFIALPFVEQNKLPQVLESLAEHHADIHIVPDTFSFVTLNKSIEDFAGMPVINLRESPLHGWNQLAKRVVDFVASAILLLLFSPVLLAITIAIKTAAPGPIFYYQERMGLDGRLFGMVKFRTMKVDAESETGAVWAKEDDPRRTRLGSFLRAHSLDELPQLWNVLCGEMSLVGPRPERPVFIEEFKRTVPRYMLRHKVKAGMTGWAQINGWRGNTSLRKRIQYDLDYIERWSMTFDLKILFLTAFKGFASPNAY